MIDKQTLIDMGFVHGKYGDHEVYYHESDFWVHFGEVPHESRCNISANLGMKDFFEKFFENYGLGIKERYME